jgi:peptidylprolyl isomerase
MQTGRIIALAAAATLALTGCGSSKKAESSAPGSVALPAESSDINVKPVIPKPEGEPPTGLQARDVVQGNGDTAESGDQVTVDYVGVSWSTGEQFDASWDSGRPFPFRLGAGEVIPGWDQGVSGMRVGGRRQLVIPPDLAYGPQGRPPVIGPNETLVFVVDLKKVKKPKG